MMRRALFGGVTVRARRACTVGVMVALTSVLAGAGGADLVLPTESNPAAAVPSRPYSLYLGADLGILLPVGIEALVMVPHDDRPRWDFDVLWEPSNYLQS